MSFYKQRVASFQVFPFAKNDEGLTEEQKKSNREKSRVRLNVEQWLIKGFLTSFDMTPPY